MLVLRGGTRTRYLDLGSTLRVFVESKVDDMGNVLSRTHPADIPSIQESQRQIMHETNLPHNTIHAYTDGSYDDGHTYTLGERRKISDETKAGWSFVLVAKGNGNADVDAQHVGQRWGPAELEHHIISKLGQSIGSSGH